MSRLGRILPVIAVAMLAVADLQVAGWGWTASATGPSNRTLALVVVWTFAAAVGIFTIARAPRDRLARLWPLAALVGWAAISGLFGIDPARAVFAALGLAAVALAAVAAALGPGRGFLGVAAGTGLFTYASLVGDAISPADDSLFLGRFGGYASEPNVMAYIAGLFIVCGAISAAGTKRRAASAAIIAISLPAGLYAVVESDTRTAFGALAVAGLVAAFDRAPMPLIVAGFVAAVLVYPQVDLTDATSAVRRDSTEQLSELNGRTPIWRLSFNAIEQDPLTGAGLASGDHQIRALTHGEGITLFSASSHNHAIEIARELGLVGLGLALVALVGAAPWKSRRLRPLLAYLLVMSVTMPTSGLPGLITAAWFVVIATGSTSSPGVHSTALGEGRQESVGSIRGTDGRRLPLHQP